MGLATLGRIDALLNVVRANLPRHVQSSGEYGDWAVVGPGLVFICADLSEGIFASVPPRGSVRAEVLARSLCEHAITFAWLAAVNGEDRDARLQQFVAYEFRHRESAERKLYDQIGRQQRYAHLFDDPERGLPAEQLLSDETKERVKELEGVPPRPDVLQMAFRADERWMGEFEAIRRNPFAFLYFLIFTGSSFTTHASVTAVDRVVVGDPPNLIVGMPQGITDSEQHGVYGMAAALLALVLLISSRAQGWPPADEVAAAFTRE
jgi:hypothetical protein